MTNGWGHDTNFSRTSRRVLEHLSAASGLPTWLLSRTNAGVSQVLAVVDPAGMIHLHQSVATDVGFGAASRVSVPMPLNDGSILGELTGFGTAPLSYADVEALRTTAAVFAAVLGALADSERTLAVERRSADRRVAALDQSQRDPLTGLATRMGWEHRFKEDELFCAEFGENAAVMVLELDELKRDNELHGHQAGDDQLRTAGGIVRDVLGEGHYAARITGDRLGVLMVGTTDHEISEVERRLRQAFGETQISLALGVGVRHPDSGLEGCLLEAEEQIEQHHTLQSPASTDATEAAAVLEAIELGAIKAYFQPIVDLRTGAVVAIEALARWQTRDGIREPDQFLPAVQQAGLLGALFDRILDDGLAHLAEFRHIVPNLQLAVNFEFDSKPDNSLLESVKSLLEKHRVPAEALSIELGERQSFDLPAPIRNELIAIEQLGVKLVLDDFGTGFASLETLTSLPISGVKLDRRFTSQVVNGDREPVVVKAMIAMAAEAGLTVIAEGIEMQLQCDRLVRMGCRLGQGYLFALPQPADSLGVVLSAPLVSTF